MLPVGATFRPFGVGALIFPPKSYCRHLGQSVKSSSAASPSISFTDAASPNLAIVVLREASSTDDFDDAGIYAGTNTGQLFYSRDSGDSWELMADYLPPIHSVEASVIEM